MDVKSKFSSDLLIFLNKIKKNLTIEYSDIEYALQFYGSKEHALSDLEKVAVIIKIFMLQNGFLNLKQTNSDDNSIYSEDLPAKLFFIDDLLDINRNKQQHFLKLPFNIIQFLPNETATTNKYQINNLELDEQIIVILFKTTSNTVEMIFSHKLISTEFENKFSIQLNNLFQSETHNLATATMKYLDKVLCYLKDNQLTQIKSTLKYNLRYNSLNLNLIIRRNIKKIGSQSYFEKKLNDTLVSDKDFTCINQIFIGIVDLPIELIERLLLKYLNLKSIIGLMSTNKYFYYDILNNDNRGQNSLWFKLMKRDLKIYFDEQNFKNKTNLEFRNIYKLNHLTKNSSNFAMSRFSFL